ncbi:MAG: hypothetical protein SVK08_01120 [Halobacteriota archaeon]|nr:hypothetical protein [Halobacteriota archaeon]
MRRKVTELDENEKAEFEEFMRENGYEVHQIEEEGVLRYYIPVDYPVGHGLNVREIERISETSSYRLCLRPGRI